MRFQPQTRIDNDPQKIDTLLIEEQLRSGVHVIVQFSHQCYNDEVLAKLNALCGKYDENFGIRFYGFYGDRFDCLTLRRLPNVKCLYIDCLTQVENLEAITELGHLRKLSLGIFEMGLTEILSASNFHYLQELILTDTRSKALNLEFLRDYKNLSKLHLSGHAKNIESVGELNKLQYLSISTPKSKSLEFINRLPELKILHMILGGRENINEIGGNHIEELEVIRVRGFNDLGDTTRFKSLQVLKIEDQLQLKSLHFTSPSEIRSLKILNCKSFEKLTDTRHLNNLIELRFWQTAIDVDVLLKDQLPECLRLFSVRTTSAKKNELNESKIISRGYTIQ